MMVDRLFKTYTEVGEDQSQNLSDGPSDDYVTEVKPPVNGDIPATLDRFVQGIIEIQSKWLGLRNASPVTAFEIRRTTPDRLRFQFAVPTKRLDRRIRTQLTEEVPGVDFDEGVSGLPVTKGDSIGGGLLALGREDFHPLNTDFDRPPLNSPVVALHPHAMQDSKILIQIIFAPDAGHPIRRWRWTRRAFKRIGYLRKQKPHILPQYERPATPQEKDQADQIEKKARNPRLHVGIRILVIGAGEYTPSRVKEIAGSFNVFENSVSNQYLDIFTVRSLFPSRIRAFADSIRRRQLDRRNLKFQVSKHELAGLVSIPDRHQENIRYSKP